MSHQVMYVCHVDGKFYIMEKRTKIAAGLLPNYFRKAGIAVIVLAFVPLVIARAANITLSPSSNEVFRLLSMNAFILGLLFIAWARDKVEDELTIAIRQHSMLVAFIWGVLNVIIKPFIDMLVKDPVTDLKAQELISSMLLIYLVLYFVQKKTRK
jgi:uncharacterized membrane protein YvlD (DUF360 family)